MSPDFKSGRVTADPSSYRFLFLESRESRNRRDGSQSLPVREPAVEQWRKTLAQIPTVFGRLVYMASLRDPETKQYVHHGLTSILGAEDAARTLCHSHHQVFAEWISFSLAEQKADLDEFLKTVPPRNLFIMQYVGLVPPTAREVEKQLYITDLETLLELRRYADEGAGNRGA